MQFVEVELDPGEAAVAEAGAMFYMEDGIAMETIFGDGSRPASGIVDALLGAGQRLLTGAGRFITVFSNAGQAKNGCLSLRRRPERSCPSGCPRPAGNGSLRRIRFWRPPMVSASASHFRKD